MICSHTYRDVYAHFIFIDEKRDITQDILVTNCIL